mgnify:CR=1 FL=1
MAVRHWLNRRLEVWRPVVDEDGSGGFTTARVQVGEVAAKVDQPAAREREESDRWGGDHTHDVYVLPEADVARGDELRGDGQVFRVLAVVEPSTPIYRKCLVELRQAEPDPAES